LLAHGCVSFGYRGANEAAGPATAMPAAPTTVLRDIDGLVLVIA
jgi:hypothetical protein